MYNKAENGLHHFEVDQTPGFRSQGGEAASASDTPDEPGAADVTEAADVLDVLYWSGLLGRIFSWESFKSKDKNMFMFTSGGSPEVL